MTYVHATETTKNKKRPIHLYNAYDTHTHTTAEVFLEVTSAHDSPSPPVAISLLCLFCAIHSMAFTALRQLKLPLEVTERIENSLLELSMGLRTENRYSCFISSVLGSVTS